MSTAPPATSCRDVRPRSAHVAGGGLVGVAVDAPGHDPPRADADPRRIEQERGADALADLLTALGVRLRAPADLDAAGRPRIDGGDIVHHQRHIGPAARVAELLAAGQGTRGADDN